MIFRVRTGLFFVTVLVMSACATQRESIAPPYLDKAYPWQEEAHKILTALNEGEVDRANMLANLALQRFPREPALHTLNGLSYEHLGGGGSPHRNDDLAEMAYQTSLNLDPNNWYTLYRMGRLQVSLDRHVIAQRYFARAIEFKPKDAQLFYEMAYASYYARDLPCAFISIQKALEYLEKDSPRRPLFLRAGALIAAAAGKADLADTYRCELEKSKKCDRSDLTILTQCMDRWLSFHEKLHLKRTSLGTINDDPSLGSDSMVNYGENSSLGGSDSDDDSGSLGGDSDGDSGSLGGDSDGDSGFAGGGGSYGSGSIGEGSVSKPIKLTPAEKKDPVIVFECVLLALQESVDTQKGQNLLKQFQGGFNITNGTDTSLPNAPGLGYQSSGISSRFYKDLSGNLLPDQESAKIFTRTVSWGPISYNANILNVTNQRLETLSRPILNSFIGKPASFSSGQVVIGGLQGSSGGSLVNIPIGTIITITATSVKGKTVDVDVDMETSTRGTVDPTEGLASQIMDVNKSRVQTKLRLQFNETGMVGGNYERFSSYNKDAVPLLGKIPLVQYFFADEKNAARKTSILFLITPRRRAEAERQFKKVSSLRNRHKRWSDLYNFMKRGNRRALIDTRDMGIFYDEKISKLAFYFRGDMVRIPDENLENAIGSLRNFIYY